MIRSFEQNNASMRPTGQQDRALDGTHGRIKRRKKSFYKMKKSCLRKTHFVTGCHDLEVNEALFYKGFRTRKRAVLDVDDKYIIPVKKRGSNQ